MCTLPPLCLSRLFPTVHSQVMSRCFLGTSYGSLCRIRPSPLMWIRGWVGLKSLLGLGVPWRAYLNRLITESSSQWGGLMLILCTVTLDPWMHRCVDHTKVMAILLLTYLHVLKYGFRQFFARQLANLFRVAVASTPSSPSTEASNGEKCLRWWRHDSKYIFFFSWSTSCRHFSSVFAEWDLAYMFITYMSWT